MDNPRGMLKVIEAAEYVVDRIVKDYSSGAQHSVIDFAEAGLPNSTMVDQIFSDLIAKQFVVERPSEFVLKVKF